MVDYSVEENNEVLVMNVNVYWLLQLKTIALIL